MTDLDKTQYFKLSKIRVRDMCFGDPVTNICAGDKNPTRLGYFVEYKQRSNLARCTDKKGKFWEIGIGVVYPGHLEISACKDLYAPVWEMQYGKKE